MDELELLETSDEVIDALGGNGATAKLTGKSHKAVCNWRSAQRGSLPPDTFLICMAALKARGKTAPSRLWGIKEAAE